MLLDIAREDLAGTTAGAVPSAATFLRPPEGEGRRLGEEVGQEQVVHAVQVVVRLREGEEVDGDEVCSLVQQLVERVLTVGTRFAPDDLATSTGSPSSVTDFPLDSMHNCWR